MKTLSGLPHWVVVFVAMLGGLFSAYCAADFECNSDCRDNVPSWAYNISREGYKVTMDQSCGYSENTLSGARHKLTGTNATCVESTTDTVSVKFYKWNFDACCDGNEWPAQCTLGTFQENRDPIPAGICFPLSS